MNYIHSFNKVLLDLHKLNIILHTYIKNYYIVFQENEENISQRCLDECNKLIIKKNCDNHPEKFLRLLQKCK